jgi:hypothetical protein
LSKLGDKLKLGNNFSFDPHFCSLDLLQDIKANYGPLTMALAKKYIRENLAALQNADEYPWQSVSDAHLSVLRKFSPSSSCLSPRLIHPHRVAAEQRGSTKPRGT